MGPRIEAGDFGLGSPCDRLQDSQGNRNQLVSACEFRINIAPGLTDVITQTYQRIVDRDDVDDDDQKDRANHIKSYRGFSHAHSRISIPASAHESRQAFPGRVASGPTRWEREARAHSDARSGGPGTSHRVCERGEPTAGSGFHL